MSSSVILSKKKPSADKFLNPAKSSEHQPWNTETPKPTRFSQKPKPMGKLRMSLMGGRFDKSSLYGIDSSLKRSTLIGTGKENIDIRKCASDTSSDARSRYTCQNQPYTVNSKFLLHQNETLKTPKAPQTSILTERNLNIGASAPLNTFSENMMQDVFKNKLKQGFKDSVSPGTFNISSSVTVYSEENCVKKRLFASRGKSPGDHMQDSYMDSSTPSNHSSIGKKQRSDFKRKNSAFSRSLNSLHVHLNSDCKNKIHFDNAVNKKIQMSYQNDVSEARKEVSHKTSTQKGLPIVDFYSQPDHNCKTNSDSRNEAENGSFSFSFNITESSDEHNASLESFEANESAINEMENREKEVGSISKKKLSNIVEEDMLCYTQGKCNDSCRSQTNVNVNNIYGSMTPLLLKTPCSHDTNMMQYINTTVNELKEQKMVLDNAWETYQRGKVIFDTQFDVVINNIMACLHSQSGPSSIIEGTGLVTTNISLSPKKGRSAIAPTPYDRSFSAGPATTSRKSKLETSAANMYTELQALKTPLRK